MCEYLTCNQNWQVSWDCSRRTKN